MSTARIDRPGALGLLGRPVDGLGVWPAFFQRVQ
jgi:hypothetical protein